MTEHMDPFSNMNEFVQGSYDSSSSSKKVQEILDLAEKTIKMWSSGASGRIMLWEDQPEQVMFYLKIVDQLQSLMEKLFASRSDRASLDRTQDLLELAMVRLKEEFTHMLVVHSEAVNSDSLNSSFPNSEGEEGVASDSSDDDDEDGEEFIPVALPVTNLNITLNLIPSERVRDLNVIAQRLVRAGYEKESCHVYVGIRKASLELSLFRLGVERTNVEAIKNMAWEVLEVKIRKWIQALKVAIKVILASERKLCDKVFTGLSPWRETCFAELATGSMLYFLTFGKAIATTRRTPEKLSRILDMYEILRDLLPEIKAIFCDEICESLVSEVTVVLQQLGEAACETLKGFENAIQKDTPKASVRGGAVHPLSRYVMNYIKYLIDYSDTINQLLRDTKREAPKFGLADSLQSSTNSRSPSVVQMMWLILFLESNLREKSRLYNDLSLGYLFLMNNMFYIVQKVKQSDLAVLLGDDWVQFHFAQVQRYAAKYQSLAWKNVFTCLRDEGIIPSESLANSSSRMVIKERFKNFNVAFEEACRVHSTWVVPDSQLKEYLRFSIAEKLIPAYRTFVDCFGHYLEAGRHPDKYIKYAPDDLENCLIELFDGVA